MKGPTVVIIDLSEPVPSPINGPRSQHPVSRWILPLATLLVVAPLLGPGSTVAGPVPIGIRITRSDVVLAAHLAEHRPGCSAAVGIDGVVVWSGSHGVADMASGAKLTTDSVFDIGGASQHFTAVAILLLAGEGALNLDDTVASHLPGLPDWADRLTVDQLLHHTTGIPDYVGLLRRQGHEFTQRTTQLQALQAVAGSRELLFDPGQGWLSGSHSNYLLLAEIVGTVAGMDLPQYLRMKVFDPLGLDIVMSRTGVVPNKAKSYFDEGHGPQPLDWNWEQLGIGGVQARPAELVRWADNFRTGAVGGQRLLDAQLANPVNDTADDGEKFAFGAGVDILGDGTLLMGGGWEGFRTGLRILPDRHTSLALSCNSSILGSAMRDIDEDLRKIWT
jgi:CubicO group peptidase (beta-lactamase class C family)